MPYPVSVLPHSSLLWMKWMNLGHITKLVITPGVILSEFQKTLDRNLFSYLLILHFYPHISRYHSYLHIFFRPNYSPYKAFYTWRCHYCNLAKRNIQMYFLSYKDKSHRLSRMTNTLWKKKDLSSRKLIHQIIDIYFYF